MTTTPHPIDQIFKTTELHELNFKESVLTREKNKLLLKNTLTVTSALTLSLFLCFSTLPHFKKPPESFIALEQLNDYTEQLTSSVEQGEMSFPTKQEATTIELLPNEE